MALNLKLTLPTAETHPELPFWEIGYTPEQVYDLFFPVGFRFICNPQRPAVCGRFGTGKERLWRFEFVVKRDEDPNVMAGDSETMRIILPYLTHDGSKYRYATDSLILIRNVPNDDKDVYIENPIPLRLHRSATLTSVWIFCFKLQQVVNW